MKIFRNKNVWICVLTVVLVLGAIENKKRMNGTAEEEMTQAVRFVNASILAERKKIALTFDDGPCAGCTDQLLDGLKKRNVKATFFLIGKNAENHPKLVQRIYEEGHLIGNHTYSHVEITKVSDEEAIQELQKTNQIIWKITGEHVQYMRPPFGAWQKELESRLEVLPVLWTVDPLDWTTENVEEIVNKVVTETKENDIILLHDCYKSSVEAALRIIDDLQKEGYEFVTVDQLLLD